MLLRRRGSPGLLHLLTSFEGRIGRGRFWLGLGALVVAGLALGGTANVLDWRSTRACPMPAASAC